MTTTTTEKSEPTEYRRECAALVDIARTKLDRGLPLTLHERLAFNVDLAWERSKEVLKHVSERRGKNDTAVLYTQGAHNSARLAVRLILAEVYMLSARQSDRRQEIEKHVAELHQRILELEEHFPSVEGTFDPKKDYRAGAIVALNGASFVARRDKPGPCPGAGWQLSASQGKRGKPGPRVKALTVDGQGMLTLTNADGSTVKCDLYPLLSKVERT